MSFISFMARLISEPGNPQYGIIIMVFLSYNAYMSGFPLDWIVIQMIGCLIGLVVCGILKWLVPSRRPTIATKYPWDGWFKERDDTNFPSGHSFAGIVGGLIVLDYAARDGFDYLWMGIWFLSWPVLRYVGQQHTAMGVGSGVGLGLVTYAGIQYMISRDVTVSWISSGLRTHLLCNLEN
jgi:ABC-type thiamin/hydroxymethylpyrimidine transport system permease subunit